MAALLQFIKAHWSRFVLPPIGVFLLFFAPPSLSERTLVRFGGVMAILSGVLGPHLMGIATTAVILVLVYAFGIGPMRLVALVNRDDALGKRGNPASFWRKKPAPNPITGDAKADERRRYRFQF